MIKIISSIILILTLSSISAIAQDTDGDGIVDNDDICPKSSGISSIAFDEATQPDIERLEFCVSFVNDIPTLNFSIAVSNNFSDTNSSSLLFWLEDEEQTWAYPTRANSADPFILSFPLHEQAASGPYTIRAFNLTDNDGLEVRFNQGILETLGFSVTTQLDNPNSDSVKPEVVSLSSDGWTIDEDGKPNLSAIIEVADQGSGMVGTRGILELISPTGKSIQSSAYVTDENTLAFNFTESEYTSSGDYNVGTIRLYDLAGNSQMSYEWLADNPTSFTLNNPNSDSVLSELAEFKLSASFDNESDRPVIEVSGIATDNLSGVERIYLRLHRPEGGILDKWIIEGSTGTSVNFDNIIPLTRGFTPGTYTVGYVSIVDIAGNEVTFEKTDLEALNAAFDSSINVFFPDEVDIEPPNLDLYYADEADLDGNPATDSYVVASWASLFGQWPGTTTAELMTLTFDGFSDAISSFPINFSKNSNAAGYEFIGIGCDIASLPNDGCASPADSTLSQSAYIANVVADGSQKIVSIAYASDNAQTTGLGLNIHFDSTQANLIDATVALQNAYIGGTAEKDFLFGANASNDEINAGGGDDYVYTGNGDDIVDAGEGNDLIVGGSGLGDDTYNGGDGIDTVSYKSATSAISVNLATNSANGEDIGSDQLFDVENIEAGQSDDTITLNELDNIIYAGTGNDAIISNPIIGNDTVFGEDGDDTFVWLSNSTGTLTLTGGSGKDTFKPEGQQQDANVVITDFNPSEGDLFDLSSFWLNHSETLETAIENSSTDSLISIENGSLTLNISESDTKIIASLSTELSSQDITNFIDSDGDGITDQNDSYPYPISFYQDFDGDGLPDAWEARYGLNPEDSSDATSDQDANGTTALEAFTTDKHAGGSLDLDGDHAQMALTDGLMIMRYMFGLRETALIQDAIAPEALYNTAEQITVRIEEMQNYFDIDASGNMDALTDGLMILRYLFGVTNQSLIENAVDLSATRTSHEAIIQHINSINPSDSDSDGVYDEFDLFPYDNNEIADFDGDSIGNNADTDDDNDGVADSEDIFPRDATETIDTDADGIGNNADTDDDNDGVADTSDAYATDPTKHKAQVWGESDWGKTSWKPNNSGFTWGESTWGE